MNSSNTQAEKQHQKTLIFVTGLSGAGMSSTLKALEDIGFEVFDNFPLPLIPALLQDPEGQKNALAIGIDTRSRGFDPKRILDASKTHKAQLVFLTAEEETLQNRFTETRRKHPLATDRPINAGIRKELELLHSLRKNSDFILDTTDLTIHDLRRMVHAHFKEEGQNSLDLNIMSFGFKYGLPRAADMVFDVRFLRNPHWDDSLKDQTGQNKKVGDYIKEDPDFDDFIMNLKTLIEPLVTRFEKEGKSYLTIAIGCTGGKHRSVYIAELLENWFSTLGKSAGLHHRDMERR